MVRSLGLAAGLLLALPAWGHKLHLFAFAEGERISGQVYFAGGAPATAARLAVIPQSGAALPAPTVDAEGGFAFTVSLRQNYTLTADAGDGHRAEWRLPARELAADLPLAPGVDLPADAQTLPAGSQDTEDAALAARIERAVARQIRPLREQLIAQEQQIRFQDAIGALGYIFGLMGLGLWWKHRPTRRRRPGSE